MKILLIVDMEEQYLTDEDVLGLLDESTYKETQKQIENQYNKIINKVERLKENGWTIYFTGQEEPYRKLKSIVDVILPYWGNNRELLKEIFKDKSIYIGGLWLERCVSEVSKIISNSIILRKFSLSHGIIGDKPYYGIEELNII